MQHYQNVEASNCEKRADEIYGKHVDSLYRKTDRLFAALLICEWIAAIAVAIFTSPLTWSGSQPAIHIHVLAAIFLGGLITIVPVYFAYKKPGQSITRYTIAVSQMLFSSLLIHLSGGRIETHFHVFGSLAFLAVYKDWRVLIVASSIVVVDHIVRGIFMPQTIYGVNYIEPMRWLEHAWWVVFEDAFLIKTCLTNTSVTKLLAQRQAELETTQSQIEETVTIRTQELRRSERRLGTQYAVSHILAEAHSLSDAFPELITAVDRYFVEVGDEPSTTFAEMWLSNADSGISCQTAITLHDGQQIKKKSENKQPCELIKQVTETEKCAQRLSISGSHSIIESAGSSAHYSALAFPVIVEDGISGVIKFSSKLQDKLQDEELAMFESLGQQIGQFVVRKNVELSNLQLANIVQSSSEAIIGYDTDGKIISWNRGAELLFGYAPGEAISQDSSILIPAERLDEVGMETYEEGEFETVRIRKDGTKKDVAVTNSPIIDSNDNVIGNSLILRDITERKESERRVGEFYSTVSHELRSPLTSIRGALGLIEGGVVDASSGEASELIKVARESSDRLIRLINDILDLKKIESGKFELAKQEIESQSLIESVVESLAGMSLEAGIILDHKNNSSQSFLADKDRCTQVLINLTSNAIKFSPPGSVVSLTASVNEANGAMRFSVIDTGPGIAPDQMHKLFDKFQQLDSSDTRKQGGTGLGLAISKAIVEEHGGTINVHSTLGAGTTFWFEIPSSKANTNPEQINQEDLDQSDSVNAEIGSGVKDNVQPEQTVLIIEDDEQLAKVLSVHIASHGFKVDKVGTLADARQQLASNLPSVIILDLTLPDGDGLALLEEFAENPAMEHIPVVVITGRGKDKSISYNPMIFDWLQKPFDTDTLILSIEKSLVLMSRRKVMVIGRESEDSGEFAYQAYEMGLECMEVHDQSEAVKLSEEWAPDLVLVDYDLLDDHLRANVLQEQTKSLPLFVCSNKEQYDQCSCSQDFTEQLKPDETFKSYLSKLLQELIAPTEAPTDAPPDAPSDGVLEQVSSITSTE